MAFGFDVEALKKHPYAIGGAIIAGGLIIFYLLSRGGSSSASGGSDVTSALQYDSQMAQIQASLQAQQNQSQTQLAQSQLEAQVSNTQTAASLNAQNTATESQLATNIAGILGSIYQTNASTVNNANELVYTENIQNMADSVLEDQLNAGLVEHANDNATALGATLAGDQMYEQNVQTLAPDFGKQYNTGNDANRAFSEIETVLTQGNPGVAVGGENLVQGVTTSGNNTASSITNSVAGVISKLL